MNNSYNVKIPNEQFLIFLSFMKAFLEAALRRYSSKQVFLNNFQYSEQKKLQHRCFPVNIASVLTTAFYGTPPVTVSV